MRISLMTILTINLSLSVFLIVLLLLLSREFILRNIGSFHLALCCIAVMIRALVPLEFPFSRTIPVAQILPAIRDFLKYPVPIGKFTVKVSMLLLFLWIFVAVILIFRKVWLYARLQKMISRLPECENEKILAVMRSLQKKYPAAKNIKTVTAKLDISPLITGLKNPVILLPEYPFSPEEYRMILEHEILHCIRHDVLIKFAADILCSIYWWNPLFYLLRSKVFELVELGNDRQLTSSFSSGEKAAYMKCITDTAKKISGYSVPFTLSFDSRDGKALRRRIHLIGSFGETGRVRNGLVVTVILIFLWVSTSFTLEPYKIPESSPDENFIRFDKYNSYIIPNGELYDIYYQGELFFTVDSLEYYDPDIPIYQSKGDD